MPLLWTRKVLRVVGPLLEVLAQLVALQVVFVPLAVVHALLSLLRLCCPRCLGLSRRPQAAPRVVAITGASSGIGAALAKRYARPGAVLYLAGRSRTRLDAVASECRSLGADVVADEVDVTDRAAVTQWIERSDRATALDVVFANAGLNPSSAREELGASSPASDVAMRILTVNLMGCAHVAYAAVERMAERGTGRVVLVGSLKGNIRSLSPYAVSKAGVDALAATLRSEYAKRGVCVTLVTPGFVATYMTSFIKSWKPMEMKPEQAAEIIAEGVQAGDAVVAWPAVLAIATRLVPMIPAELLHLCMRVAGLFW
eukprot:m51a1_g7896 putative short-chain dehydrogenase (314) ;mRNA; r:117457-119016